MTIDGIPIGQRCVLRNKATREMMSSQPPTTNGRGQNQPADRDEIFRVIRLLVIAGLQARTSRRLSLLP
jgi:hypothetical protein